MPDLLVRPQDPADDAAVHDVESTAFGADGEHVAVLAEALRARPDPGASLVAVVDGELVGHVQLSTSWVDAPDRVLPVLVLSPLAVRPDHHRRGIGSALVAAARAEAERLAAPLLFLEGDPRYYSRLGFVAAVPLGFTRPSVRIPEQAFQVIALPAWTGGTGALVYNDTFWTHDAVGLRGDRASA